MANFYTLTEAVDRLETTPLPAQELLMDVLLEMLYREKRKAVGLYADKLELARALEAAGVLLCVSDPEQQLRAVGEYARKTKQYTLVYDRLLAAGYTDLKKNEDHVAFCLEHPELINVAAGDCFAVVLVPEMERCRRKIYTYLGRKLLNDSYCDENMNCIEYPKGAEYRGAVSVLNGDRKSGWYYNDDEINRLLEKYGHLRCPIWREG